MLPTKFSSSPAPPNANPHCCRQMAMQSERKVVSNCILDWGIIEHFIAPPVAKHERWEDAGCLSLSLPIRCVPPATRSPIGSGAAGSPITSARLWMHCRDKLYWCFWWFDSMQELLEERCGLYFHVQGLGGRCLVVRGVGSGNVVGKYFVSRSNILFRFIQNYPFLPRCY